MSRNKLRVVVTVYEQLGKFAPATLPEVNVVRYVCETRMLSQIGGAGSAKNVIRIGDPVGKRRPGAAICSPALFPIEW